MTFTPWQDIEVPPALGGYPYGPNSNYPPAFPLAEDLWWNYQAGNGQSHTSPMRLAVGRQSILISGARDSSGNVTGAVQEQSIVIHQKHFAANGTTTTRDITTTLVHGLNPEILRPAGVGFNCVANGLFPFFPYLPLSFDLPSGWWKHISTSASPAHGYIEYDGDAPAISVPDLYDVFTMSAPTTAPTLLKARVYGGTKFSYNGTDVVVHKRIYKPQLWLWFSSAVTVKTQLDPDDIMTYTRNAYGQIHPTGYQTAYPYNCVRVDLSDFPAEWQNASGTQSVHVTIAANWLKNAHGDASGNVDVEFVQAGVEQPDFSWVPHDENDTTLRQSTRLKYGPRGRVAGVGTFAAPADRPWLHKDDSDVVYATGTLSGIQVKMPAADAVGDDLPNAQRSHRLMVSQRFDTMDYGMAYDRDVLQSVIWARVDAFDSYTDSYGHSRDYALLSLPFLSKNRSVRCFAAQNRLGGPATQVPVWHARHGRCFYLGVRGSHLWKSTDHHDHTRDYADNAETQDGFLAVTTWEVVDFLGELDFLVGDWVALQVECPMVRDANGAWPLSWCADTPGMDDADNLYCTTGSTYDYSSGTDYKAYKLSRSGPIGHVSVNGPVTISFTYAGPAFGAAFNTNSLHVVVTLYSAAVSPLKIPTYASNPPPSWGEIGGHTTDLINPTITPISPPPLYNPATSYAIGNQVSYSATGPKRIWQALTSGTLPTPSAGVNWDEVTDLYDYTYDFSAASSLSIDASHNEHAHLGVRITCDYSAYPDLGAGALPVPYVGIVAKRFDLPFHVGMSGGKDIHRVGRLPPFNYHLKTNKVSDRDGNVIVGRDGNNLGWK